MRSYRRSKHLVGHWRPSQAVLYNYATGVQSTLSSPTWQILDFCGDWKTRAEIGRTVLRGVPARITGPLLQSLVAATFLEPSDRGRDPREERMDRWGAWNPSAGFFHSSSRQVDFGDPAAFEAALRDKARHHPVPAPVKPSVGRSVGLPDPRRSNALTRLAGARRTWRQFGRLPISRAALSHLLWLSSGITHWLQVPGLDEVPITMSPSAGARHPIETYVAVLRVRGMAPGLYRYAPDRHELDLVRRSASAAELRRFIPHQPWVGDCGAAVFFAAVFARTQWRYDYSRAYRAVLLEAGHRCQMLLLAATGLGLAPFCTMATDDRRIERALKINGTDEAVLYAATIGTPAAVRGRIVMPVDSPVPSVRANTVMFTSSRKRRS